MRRNESGAVVPYVIGAVLLVAVVIGGIYFAHYRGGLHGETTLEIGQQKTDDKQDQANKGNDTKKDDSKDTDEKSAADKKAEEDARAKVAAEEKKKAEEAKKAEAQKKADAAAKEEAEADTESTPMERQEVAAANTLPTTGPVEDFLASIIGVVALVGAGYVYYHFGRK